MLPYLTLRASDLAIGSSESSSLPPFFPVSFLSNVGLKFSYFNSFYAPAFGVGTGFGYPSLDVSFGATVGSFFLSPGYYTGAGLAPPGFVMTYVTPPALILSLRDLSMGSS